jgi:hypothetical protein
MYNTAMEWQASSIWCRNCPSENFKENLTIVYRMVTSIPCRAQGLGAFMVISFQNIIPTSSPFTCCHAFFAQDEAEAWRNGAVEFVLLGPPGFVC